MGNTHVPYVIATVRNHQRVQLETMLSPSISRTVLPTSANSVIMLWELIRLLSDMFNTIINNNEQFRALN